MVDVTTLLAFRRPGLHTHMVLRLVICMIRHKYLDRSLVILRGAIIAFTLIYTLPQILVDHILIRL